MLDAMSFRVTLHPSGHEFQAEGADTVLEAALKAGLAVNYGCSNGNCGLCKARVVSGQVEKVRHHDYRLSEAEKGQGYVLLCANAPRGDLVVEALENAEAGDIPQQQIVARIKALEPLGENVRLLHLQTPRTNRLRYLAGQSAVLTAGDASAELPIASCPCDERNLHFHVARDARNAFACKVFDDLRVGEAVSILGPSGDFVLRAESPRPPLFVAAETGFAPIKGLIEHALSLERGERLHLYWHAARTDGHYLDNLCRAWADALDNFRYSPITGGDAAGFVAGMAGELADPAACDVYLAGPAAFVEAAAKALDERGFPAAQRFSTIT